MQSERVSRKLELQLRNQQKHRSPKKLPHVGKKQDTTEAKAIINSHTQLHIYTCFPDTQTQRKKIDLIILFICKKRRERFEKAWENKENKKRCGGDINRKWEKTYEGWIQLMNRNKFSKPNETTFGVREHDETQWDTTEAKVKTIICKLIHIHMWPSPSHTYKKKQRWQKPNTTKERRKTKGRPAVFIKLYNLIDSQILRCYLIQAQVGKSLLYVLVWNSLLLLSI